MLFIIPEYGHLTYFIYFKTHLKIQEFRYSIIDGSQYFFQMVAIVIFKVKLVRVNAKRLIGTVLIL